MSNGGWDWVSPSGLVVARGDNFTVGADSIDDAKAALKELKFLKKDIQLEKKVIASDLKLIRTERSQHLARQGSMMRGGGQFGKVVRSIERAGRDRDRRNHANQMEPYQQRIAALDDRINQVDQVIAMLERHLHELQMNEQMEKATQRARHIPAFPVCPSCGAVEDEGARFCGNCGIRL